MASNLLTSPFIAEVWPIASRIVSSHPGAFKTPGDLSPDTLKAVRTHFENGTQTPYLNELPEPFESLELLTFKSEDKLSLVSYKQQTLFTTIVEWFTTLSSENITPEAINDTTAFPVTDYSVK